MKSIWLVLFLLIISGTSHANTSNQSNEAVQVWRNTGMCLSFLESIRQTRKVSAEEEQWQKAVSRATLAFINASKSAGMHIDTSSQDAFHRDIQIYIDLFGKVLPVNDKSALSKLFDECTLQFY